MILNLFSVFDPQVFLNLSINWLSRLIIFLLIPFLYWFNSSRIIYFLLLFIIKLWVEFKIIILNKFNLLNLIIFIVLFFFIIFNNFIGLFPYIFTSSRHIIYAVSFALSIWFGLIFFGWLKNTTHMLIHLLPQGTPLILIFFIVFIEILSNLIRSLTLSIRLTANIIAGHLLLVLLGRFIPNIFILYLIVLLIQLMLLILEMAVSIIQSYVFVILIILYLKETN